MSALPAIDKAEAAPYILKAASQLGVFGSAALSAPRILGLLCSPETRLPEVSALIRNEPGLAARVLRVANSAFYGLSRSVKTIDRALVVLGLDAVRGIAAAACLDRTVMRAPEIARLNRAALVRHSLATGAAAEALARIRHRPLAPEAFIAGLLHNLGVPVQALLDPEGVKAMIDALLVDPDQDIRMLETMRAVPGHEQCIAVVFEAWNLPASLVQAVATHHEPLMAPGPHRDLAALLHLGMQLAQATGHHFPLEPHYTVRHRAAMQQLGLVDEELDAVQSALPERLALLQQALSDV